MNRKAKYPKKRVLSVRITDLEWEMLEKVRQKNPVDVSTILRKGLHDFFQTGGKG